MKGNYTIFISVIVIIILLGVLLYLQFFNSQKEEAGPSDIFSNLEFDQANSGNIGGQNTPGSSVDTNEFVPSSEVVRLRQLTTKNTIGFSEVLLSTTTPPLVYFGESGVGHIYSIDLTSGNETRVGITTIPDAREMLFSADGQYIAVKTGNTTGDGRLQIGTIGPNGVVTLTALETTVADMKMIGSTLLYAVRGNTSVQAFSYSLATAKKTSLFSVPFKEAIVDFGDAVAGPHLAYPKTSAELQGFAYQYENGRISRLALDGFGFTAKRSSLGTLVTRRDQSTLKASLVTTTETIPLAQPFFANKCTGVTRYIICGHDSLASYKFSSVDSWLKGTEAYRDNPWLITGTGESLQLIDVERTSGRAVDLIKPAVGTYTNDLYFVNKNDSTLWWYDLSTDIVTGELDSDI